MNPTFWHVFKQQGDEMFWLACIEADDAESAVAVYAHQIHETGDTTVPTEHNTLLHVVTHEAFHLVEAGWHFDPAQLHVNPVHINAA